MHDLDKLISRARTYLVDSGYARSTIAHYEAAWKRPRAWCEKAGVEGYDHDAERRFIEEGVIANPGAAKYFKLDKRRVLLLLSIEEAGGPPGRVAARRRFTVPAGFEAAYGAYSAELEARGLRASTRRGYLCTVRNFCESCGASRPDQLDARSIGTFAEGISRCAPQTRSAKPYVARDFTRFLARTGPCGPEVPGAAPLMPGHKHSAVPSAHAAADVSSMVSGFPSSVRPKRDRATLPLASVLGMRVGDIKALKLGDIDRRAKTVPFVQGKTRAANVLPMPEEVWLAVADCLMDERPDVGGDRLFITACAPCRSMDPSHVFHRMVTRSFADAGVEAAGKHHGMHSLRHPAATNMPAGGTPYTTISSVLGHSSVNVTKRHLPVDVESLRPLALEVPGCRR